MRIKNSFLWLALICGLLVLGFILFPLLRLLTAPDPEQMGEALRDVTVRKAIWLSVHTAGLAALISLLLGTPLAYILARKRFPGKSLVESVIDLPIVIPHPVVGIAILSVVGRNFWLGRILHEIGIRIMGSVTGIVVVLVFVAIPFYINAAKNGFEAVPSRLENVSRSLGASLPATFFRITLPLASRSILSGFIMSMARALSEFGAVVVVAYHPMVAPVLIYERFEGYGLKYSQPVAVWFILVCLILFLILRVITADRKTRLSKGAEI
ncbi:MAG: ABC transporter permease [Candidatus Euphemobacter frigidus]|nr:ABC transporter permease [Candidatus Euphemobacter frigidus]MDP8274968.1 ABC transporter permease [Candidatus Euphemobacter frigidus]